MARPLLPDLATADTCPLCHADHRDLDPAHACPAHGHQLPCPVQKCAYTKETP
jgi:hypothetical protein